MAGRPRYLRDYILPLHNHIRTMFGYTIYWAGSKPQPRRRNAGISWWGVLRACRPGLAGVKGGWAGLSICVQGGGAYSVGPLRVARYDSLLST